MSVERSRYTACGKCILLGEHFVVHGAPAIALPLRTVCTEVRVEEEARAAGRIQLDCDIPQTASDLSHRLLERGRERLGIEADRSWRVAVRSGIPIGYGLGSSAAFSVALVGALARAAGIELSPDGHNALAHELEKLVHGSPSGIDDTVVTHQRPIWFVRGERIRFLDATDAPRLVLASCRSPGSTKEAVSSVRALKEANQELFARMCDHAGQLVRDGLVAMLARDRQRLGRLLDENHELLRQLRVSTVELDCLVDAARKAGAHGAKLTGAGRGGFMLALVDESTEDSVAGALQRAGAALVLKEGGDP
jgi:mevalonate kinase